MKKLLWVLSLVLFFLIASYGCKKDVETITAMGSIEKLDASFSAYGTHMLVGKNSFLALKSEKINLNHFMNKPVCIVGEILDGYPLNDGPKLIEVMVVYE